MLDPDGSLYAPLTFEDESGRRLMWGWLSEQRSRDAQEAAGWAGGDVAAARALPRG